MLLQHLRIAVFLGTALLPLAMADGNAIDAVEAQIPRQAPLVNVSGVWESRDWERAFLNQTGSLVSGQLGDYKVDGLVVGQDVYLFLSYHDRVYHSLKLAAGTPGEMVGYYYYGLQSYADMQPNSGARRYSTLFRKTSNAAPPD
jgi:hypothetical protein